MQVTAPHLTRDDIAVAHVLVRVALAPCQARLPQRLPGTNIVPVRVQRHDHGTAGVLHDGVIDRLGRRSAERGGIESQEIEVGATPSVCGPHSAEQLGCVTLELREISTRAEHEHAAVPVVAALRQIALRRRAVGLLDEGLDGPGALAGRGADVAVAGRRAARLDAEGHQRPVNGRGCRGLHRARKRFTV